MLLSLHAPNLQGFYLWSRIKFQSHPVLIWRVRVICSIFGDPPFLALPYIAVIKNILSSLTMLEKKTLARKPFVQLRRYVLVVEIISLKIAQFMCKIAGVRILLVRVNKNRNLTPRPRRYRYPNPPYSFFSHDRWQSRLPSQFMLDILTVSLARVIPS